MISGTVRFKDKSPCFRLKARLSRIAEGNFGDTKPVSHNPFELRFFFGGGFRIFYTTIAGEIVLLLYAGDKSTQSIDIKQAKKIT